LRRRAQAAGYRLFYDTSILQWNGSNATQQLPRGPDDGIRPAVVLRGDSRFLQSDPAGEVGPDRRPAIIFLYERRSRRSGPAAAVHLRQRPASRKTSASSLSSSSPLAGGEGGRRYSWRGGQRADPVPGCRGVGPGYDHSAVPGRQPLIVQRKTAGLCRSLDEGLQLDPKSRPWMVHIETWNEWHEGTDIAHSANTAKATSCSPCVRRLWHAGARVYLPSSYVGAGSVSWEPEKPKGLDLRPTAATELGVRGFAEGGRRHFAESALTASRYLYFNADDAFAYNLVGKPWCSASRIGRRLLVVGRRVRQHGQSSPLDGAFRPAGTVAISGTGRGKQRVPAADCRFMNRCNGPTFASSPRPGDGACREPVAASQGRLTVPHAASAPRKRGYLRFVHQRQGNLCGLWKHGKDRQTVCIIQLNPFLLWQQSGVDFTTHYLATSYSANVRSRCHHIRACYLTRHALCSNSGYMGATNCQRASNLSTSFPHWQRMNTEEGHLPPQTFPSLSASFADIRLRGRWVF